MELPVIWVVMMSMWRHCNLTKMESTKWDGPTTDKCDCYIYNESVYIYINACTATERSSGWLFSSSVGTLKLASAFPVTIESVTLTPVSVTPYYFSLEIQYSSELRLSDLKRYSPLHALKDTLVFLLSISSSVLQPWTKGHLSDDSCLNAWDDMHIMLPCLFAVLVTFSETNIS